MTYDQVLTLDTIVKYGSFKAAAEVMHKSQPSLSIAIKKLEEEFGFQIFDRSEYRPKLTSQGKTFHRQALNLIENFQSLETIGKELGAGFETEINICVEAIFPIETISNLLEKFFEPHITTSLNLNIDVLEGVFQKLKNHEVDFAIAPDFNQQESFEKIKIMETKVIPVIAPKHLGYTSKTLKELPQIVVQSSVIERRGLVYGAFSKQFWYTSDLFMKEQLISAGLGWGSLPEHQVREKLMNGSLIKITDIKGIQENSIPIFLIRALDKILGPNTKNLWNHLSQMNFNR